MGDGGATGSTCLGAASVCDGAMDVVTVFSRGGEPGAGDEMAVQPVPVVLQSVPASAEQAEPGPVLQQAAAPPV
jgi:hypothetical protein